MPDAPPVRLNHPQPGEAELTIEGATYRLRRVYLDELEQFMLALADLQDRLSTVPDAEGMTTRQQLERAFSDRRAMVDWWRTVISTLAPEGSPALPERLPAWLSAGELATEIVTMWQGSPLAPGE